MQLEIEKAERLKTTSLIAVFSFYVQLQGGRAPQVDSPTRFPKISPVQQIDDPVELNTPGDASAVGG